MGKTRVAIDYMGFSYKLRGVRKVLIACPKIVRQVWVDQIQQYLPSEIPRLVQVYGDDGSEYDIMGGGQDPLVIIVANYDMVWRREDWFKRWKPDLVIADEAHLLKTPTSKRSKALWRLGRQATDRLALTGTPIPKRPTDAYGLMRFLDEKVFGKSYTKFKERHMIVNPYSHEVLGYQHVEEISDKMAPYGMRVLRSDVMTEPEVEHVTIPVELEPKARKVYNALAKESLAELESGETVIAPHVLTRMMRLQQITGGYTTTDEGLDVCVSTAKLEAMKELVETHLEADEQVVVVARFTPEIRAIYEKLYDYRVRFIDGSVNDRHRADILQWFQEGKIDVLVIQEATAAMGIDLSAARVMIFYSMDFSLSNYLQVRDRIMGRGQKADSVTYYYLVTPGSVDETVVRTLKNDEELADYVSNRYKEVLKPL